MAQIEIPNGRLYSDIRAHVALKDSGVAIDWNGLSSIRAYMYSVPQKALCGQFAVEVNAQDGTDLVCDYSSESPQYEGLARIVVRCVYEGRTKTYDAVLINLVPSTDNLADEPIVMDDPEVDVEIEVTEVSTSLLDEAIQAALDAAEAANAAADLANTNAGLASEAAILANSAAGSASDAAALAVQKAGLAADAATLANTKAQLADQKAGLAAEKAQAAEDAAALATQKAGLADDAAALATQKAGLADDAATLATQKAGLADTAAANADDKATLANTKAGYAQDKGDYAKQQGDYAKDQIDGAKGDFESLDARLDHNEQISMYLEETTDPFDEEYQDEYQRVLAVLYQAIVDAKAAIQEATGATFDANTAAGAAMNAVMEALQAAGYAEEKGNAAQAAAAAATAAMNAAKGTYPSLNDRLVAIEAGKQDVVEDLSDIREGAAAGATAYQKPGDGIPGSDLDETAQGSLAKAESAVQPGDLKSVATSGSYEDLTDKPGNLSDFSNNVAVTFEESDDPFSMYR